MLNDIKVVFLDAEGTFLRFYPSLGEIYKDLFGRYGIIVDPGKTEEALRSAYRKVFQETIKPPLNGEICKEAWKRVFEQVFKHLKSYPQFEILFKEAFDFFSKPECVEVIPGFREFINSLKKRGIKCAIISNWDCRLYSVLEGHGLLHHFDAVFLGCEVGYLKPDLRIFQIALDHFKVTPEETLMIGDSLKDDIEPAKQLQMKYLHISGDFNFKNLLDLQPKLNFL